MTEGRCSWPATPPIQYRRTAGWADRQRSRNSADIAWKIAFVLNGQAGPGLLETYATERYPVAKRTLDRQTTVYLDRTRARGGPPRDGIDPGYLEVALGYRYRSAAVLHDVPDDGRLDEIRETRVAGPERGCRMRRSSLKAI